MASGFRPGGTDQVVFEEGHVVVGGDPGVLDVPILVHHHQQVEQISIPQFFNFKKPLFEFVLGGGVALVDALLDLELHQMLDDAVPTEADLVDQVHQAVVDRSQDHFQVDVLAQHVADFVGGGRVGLLRVEERLEAEPEGADHVEEHELVEEEREHFGEHGVLVVVLEHEHLRRENQGEVGDVVEVDGLEPVEHELVDQVDDFIVECHVFFVDQEHEGPENVAREAQVDQLVSGITRLLEAQENQLLDDLEHVAGHGLVANRKRVFEVEVLALELVRLPCRR